MGEKKIIEYMRKKRYIDGQYICWDFVMEVAKDMYGIELPEYPVTEVQTEFKYKLLSNFAHIVVPRGEEQEGDIIVFSLFANQHAGVVISKDNYIHLSREGVQVRDIASLLGNYKVYRSAK